MKSYFMYYQENMPYTVKSTLLKISLVIPLSLPIHILHSFKLEIWHSLRRAALKLSTCCEIMLFLNLKYKVHRIFFKDLIIILHSFNEQNLYSLVRFISETIKKYWT